MYSKTSSSRSIRWPSASSMPPLTFMDSSSLTARLHIRCDDARVEGEHAWIIAVHDHLHPMVIRRAERFDAREVLERWRAGVAAGAAKWLVDAEIVAVAVHQHHRPAKGGRLALEHFAHLRKAARLLRLAAGEGRKLRKDVPLLHDHHGAAAARLRRGKALAHPGDVRRGARRVFRVALRRAAAVVVAADDMQRQ